MDVDVKHGNKFIRLTKHLYKVKNQNGLNNALYDYFNIFDSKTDGFTKKEIRQMVQNIPPYYPICMVIVDQSFECSRIYLEFFNLEEEAHRSFFYN